MRAIMKREFKAYFASPIGFVFVGLFVLLTGIFSARANLLNANADYSGVLGTITFVFLFAVPILTMRLIAEETRLKTDQLLLTSPLSIVGIVIGKYCAAETLFLLTLMITFIHPVVMSFFAPDGLAWLEIAGTYLGFFLLGSSLISIGLYFSSLTDNQLIAAVETLAILLLIWLLDSIEKNLPAGAGLVAGVLGWFSLLDRYGEFRLGLLNPGSILYHLTFCGFFVFLTIHRIEGKRMKNPSFFDAPRSAMLRNRGCMILIILVAFGLFAALATLADKSSLKIDLTKNRIFTLQERTLGIIDRLETEISIIVFLSKWSEDPMLVNILEQYTVRNPRISVRKADPDRNPGLAAKYAAAGTRLVDGSVVVIAGERFRVIESYEIYQVDTKNPERPFLTAVSAESKVTAAIEYLVSGESRTIYSVFGHGETSLSAGNLGDAIQSRNWDISDLDLATVQTVPDDAKAVVFLSPKADIEVRDTEKIRLYLERGGKAAFILGPGERSTPALDDLLGSYGIVMRNDVVVEGDRERSSAEHPLWIVPNWTIHEIFLSYSEREPRILFPGARSIRRLDLRRSTLMIQSLLASSPISWAKDGYEPGNSLVRTKNDEQGPFVLTAVISESGKEKSARLFVAGSDFLESRIVADFPDNVEFFSNCLAWLIGKEGTNPILAKKLGKIALEIAPGQAILLSGVEAILMPILILGMGIVVWLRRRHL